MSELILDLSEGIQEIQKQKAKRVVIQLPEGLKVKSFEIVNEIQTQTGAQCIVLCDPVFGACDLAEYERNQLKADIILHFGHTQFVKKDFGKTIYIPLFYEIDSRVEEKLGNELVKKLQKEKIKTIGISGVIQFKPTIEFLKKYLTQQGLEIKTGKGKLTGEAQLLGCDALSVKSIENQVDCIVYVGDGNFHSLPIQFTLDKKIFALNPLNETIEELKGDKERYLRQRYGLIALAQRAQKFGILVSLKEGQYRIELALQLKKTIEQTGKQAYVFAADLILPEFFIGLDIDCFVCTACPRISIEDAKKWKKPLINGIELEMALGKRSMENYIFEELI